MHRTDNTARVAGALPLRGGRFIFRGAGQPAAGTLSACSRSLWAARAKDLDKCLSFYADDAHDFPSGSPLIVGKKALPKEWMKYPAAPGNFSGTTSEGEVARSGDLAYVAGAYEWKTLDTKKHPVTIRGQYAVVWKKQKDSSWHAVGSIDNPDQQDAVALSDGLQVASIRSAGRGNGGDL